VLAYPLDTVPRTYENEELPEKMHFVWCNLYETKNEKTQCIWPTKAYPPK